MTQSIAFDRAAEYYDDTRGFPPGIEQDAALTIIRAGNLSASSRILEVGIGTGRIALPLAKHVGQVHGLDLSPAMMLRLRSKQNGEPIYLSQGDATRLPYADHAFDAAVGVHILHLIPGWQDVLKELIRVLKPDAPFIQCWSRNEEVFKSLWAAWRSAIPEQEAADIGLSWDKNEPTMQAQGWRIGTEQAFAYSYGRSPAVFIQQLENRVWSRTWRLSDESLAAGVAAVKAAVVRDYPDAEAPVTVHEQFVSKPYYPPQ